MGDREMFESLVKWLKILELTGPCGKLKKEKQFLWLIKLNFRKLCSIFTDSALDLSSGVALGELLTLLAPDYSPKVKIISSSKFCFNKF